MTVATNPREALLQRRREITQDADDGLVTAVAELASIDARLAELERQPEPLDVAGVLAALDQAAPADVQQIESEERVALLRRRQALAPELLAGDEAAKAELETVEARLAELDRLAEFEKLAAAETAERARIAAEAEIEAKRAAARKKMAKLDGKRNQIGAAVEAAIDALMGAIDDFGKFEMEHEAARLAADPEARPWNWRRPLEQRLAYRLHANGLRDLDYPLGGRGRTPLGSA